MLITGKYGSAKVFATVVDEETENQIKTLMDQEFIKDVNVSIMADCHAGKGCVIGTTMKINDCCVPSLVGVDIGCGMLTIKLGKIKIDLIKLDRFIRKKIPSGFEIRKEPIQGNIDITRLYCYRKLENHNRLHCSLGTLGGGNHFIEIDKDDEENLYLIIHTGSRNLGKQVCEYYMDVAYKDRELQYQKKAINTIQQFKDQHKEQEIENFLNELRKEFSLLDKSLIPLYDESFVAYLHDMEICQNFATLNREIIASEIMNFLGFKLSDFEYFHTTHNYINMDDLILRKGAISAYENETVLIPINMRDGSILAKGKSNKDYNFSAPHGAGRILSRAEANKTITLEDFKKSMQGIYSTSVQIDTIDESPFAYKSIDDILPNILDTVEVIKILKPIYNYKATNKRSR
ncbi:MAG: RtcB family protein [Bacilli bacterium]